MSTDQQTIKYLADGEIVRVLAQPGPDQIVVELGRTYEDEPDELFFDGTRVVQKVYDKPPVEAIQADVAKLEARQCTLRENIRTLEAHERDTKRRVEALKVYDQLARVEDFLAGKITHYVIYDAYSGMDAAIPRISTPEQEICGNNDRGQLKLLSLYGTKERSMEWKLNRYSDGSGEGKLCIPCLSLEEAQQKARQILATSIRNYKVPDRYNCQHGLDLMAAAKTLGVPLPDGFAEALRQCELRNRQSEVESKKKELADAVTKLQAVQGQQEF
jgi:hypothetical protein